MPTDKALIARDQLVFEILRGADLDAIDKVRAALRLHALPLRTLRRLHAARLRHGPEQ